MKNYPDHPGFKNETTSRDAAEDLATKAGTVRKKVLRAVSEEDLTTYELAAVLGLPYHTIQPRTSELKTMELIFDSGKRRIGPTLKMGIVWTTSEVEK